MLNVRLFLENIGFTFEKYGDKVQELLKNILIYNFIYVL